MLLVQHIINMDIIRCLPSFFFFFPHKVLKIPRVFDTYNTHQWGIATFQMFNSHVQLTATILKSHAGLETGRVTTPTGSADLEKLT